MGHWVELVTCAISFGHFGLDNDKSRTSTIVGFGRSFDDPLDPTSNERFGNFCNFYSLDESTSIRRVFFSHEFRILWCSVGKGDEDGFGEWMGWELACLGR